MTTPRPRPLSRLSDEDLATVVWDLPADAPGADTARELLDRYGRQSVELRMSRDNATYLAHELWGKEEVLGQDTVTSAWDAHIASAPGMDEGRA